MGVSVTKSNRVVFLMVFVMSGCEAGKPQSTSESLRTAPADLTTGATADTTISTNDTVATVPDQPKSSDVVKEAPVVIETTAGTAEVFSDHVVIKKPKGDEGNVTLTLIPPAPAAPVSSVANLTSSAQVALVQPSAPTIAAAGEPAPARQDVAVESPSDALGETPVSVTVPVTEIETVALAPNTQYEVALPAPVAVEASDKVDTPASGVAEEKPADAVTALAAKPLPVAAAPAPQVVVVTTLAEAPEIESIQSEGGGTFRLRLDLGDNPVDTPYSLMARHERTAEVLAYFDLATGKVVKVDSRWTVRGGSVGDDGIYELSVTGVLGDPDDVVFLIQARNRAGVETAWSADFPGVGTDASADDGDDELLGNLPADQPSVDQQPTMKDLIKKLRADLVASGADLKTARAALRAAKANRRELRKELVKLEKAKAGKDQLAAQEKQVDLADAAVKAAKRKVEELMAMRAGVRHDLKKQIAAAKGVVAQVKLAKLDDEARAKAEKEAKEIAKKEAKAKAKAEKDAKDLAEQEAKKSKDAKDKADKEAAEKAKAKGAEK